MRTRTSTLSHFPSAPLLLIGFCGIACAEGPLNGDGVWQAEVDPHRRDLITPELRIHYIDIGQGEPVILLHGFADSTYCWHRNHAALEQAGYRVIMIDQAGLGRSPRPSEPYQYSMENQARVVLNVADHLGLERFHYVGHSMAGAIGLHLALAHPDRIASLALLAPACYRPDNTWLGHLPGAGFIGEVIRGPWLIRQILEHIIADDTRITEAMVSEYYGAALQPGYISTLIDLSRDFFSPIFDADIDRYPRIKTPLLILFGDDDPVIPPEFGVRLLSQLPHARLVRYPNCGHLIALERPDDVDAELLQFWKTVPHL